MPLVLLLVFVLFLILVLVLVLIMALFLFWALFLLLEYIVLILDLVLSLVFSYNESCIAFQMDVICIIMHTIILCLQKYKIQNTNTKMFI